MAGAALQHQYQTKKHFRARVHGQANGISPCGRVQAKENKTTYSNLEMDSHADTIVLGRNCTILSYSGRECDVSPYTDSYESIKGVPIVTGATAWTSQVDGATYYLRSVPLVHANFF